MANRRRFLQGLTTMPVAASLAGGRAKGASSKRDYFQELGVRPFINAAGTFTTLTASLMHPEVVDAIEYASRRFVRLMDLHEAAGKRIASLIGCEAAMVTSGAASALTLGTAACMTGKNQEFIRRLPDTAGMKSEVIVQKTHRYGYDHAVRNCGVKLIEVETIEQLEAAVNGNTLMMLFFNANENVGKIKGAEFVALGQKHRVPTFNDAAADVPPVENLSKYTKMGFDLVTFSGGKGIRGPQSAGLLLGRKDLIEAARLNGSPFSDSVGRGQKVNKEEILAMMVAVESYLKRDHEADWRDWEKRVQVIVSALQKVPGVKTEVTVPDIANHTPHIRVSWEQSAIKLTVSEIQKALREGEPSIEPTPNNQELTFTVWMLQSGEDKIVARRLKEIFQSGRV